VAKLTEVFSGRTVLITGGTGSFGTKLVEIVLREQHPRAIRIYSRDELKQHVMAQRFPDERLRFLIGDVRDKDRLHRAVKDVDIVVHAAALKQVPACEYNPFEAIRTNILGTKNVIDVCIDSSVEKAIFICTDKAVNPVNLYGATKLCAEKLFVQGNSYSGAKGTRFSVARYGNVVGSRGSVVPLFLEQRKTGTITITDQRMTRFWITLEQGARFVLRCIELMHGGEIFVPKIPSMRVGDLAKTIAPDCAIQINGIRPGEKIHETLLSEDETRRTVEFDAMFVVRPEFPWWGDNDWKDGKALPLSFRYSSDTNTKWLSTEELRQMVGLETS
jgi:UDP-N-acetylglucosamine 4,6-dehydratase